MRSSLSLFVIFLSLGLIGCPGAKDDSGDTDDTQDTNDTSDSDDSGTGTDADDDGYDSEASGGDDCNDNDAAINPGATETWYDGVDQDCSGGSDYDQDLDGANHQKYGGDDCDDSDPSIRPGAKDTEGDGIDQNCDGCDGSCAGTDTIADLLVGELVINEIMANPSTSEPDTEWIEVLVNHPTEIDLLGLVITNADASRSVTIDTSMLVAPGELLVFGGDKLSFTDFSLGSIALGNTTGGVVLVAGKLVIDSVIWGSKGQPRVPTNASLSLDPDWADAALNDTDLYWCSATTAWEKGGDAGSPGMENEPCGFDNDADGYPTPEDCDDHDATIHPGADDCTGDGIDQNCDGHDGAIDTDGDGFDGCEDCDDTDLTIYPGAPETWYDGVDQDCSGGSDYDQDGDGYDSSEWGGADCDDTDPTINPGATDIEGDGVDSNCDGCEGPSLTIAELSSGDLVISEIMGNPSGTEPAEEWFEVYVAVDSCLNLEGLIIQNESASDLDTVTGTLVANGGDYIVFGRSAAEWVDFVYSDMTLSNSSADEIILSNGSLVIDQVDFNGTDEYDIPNSRSMILDPAHLDSAPDSDPDYWCNSSVVTLATDPSSPGAENESCGFGTTDSDKDGSPVPDDCDDTDPTIYPGATDTWYDGIDQDCAGDSDYDQDLDGYDSDSYGGSDCNDLDPTINPGALDTEGDSIDQDCDGCDGACPDVDDIFDLLEGELVITEIMQNPSGSEPATEWLEVYVNRAEVVDLDGLILYDEGTDRATVSGRSLAYPGEYVVLGKSASDIVDFVYDGTFSLGNGDDEVYLSNGKTIFDFVRYDGGTVWPDPSAASMIFGGEYLDSGDNNDGTLWCASETAWTSGSDLGSPGLENPSCVGVPEDLDLDGYSTPEDCDDADSAIHPDAVEVWYDGVDQDCSSTSDYDQDGDGYDSSDWGGTDCDDTDDTVNLAAVDKLGDGIDQDCDGCDGSCSGTTDDINDLVHGSLVINEVLQNPLGSEPGEEWFEIYVAHANPVDLDGLVIYDAGTDSVTVSGTLLVEPGEFVVIGKTLSAWVDYAYTGSFTLGNSDDEIILSNGVLIVDEIYYDNGVAFPDPSGATMNLDPDYMNATDNDEGGYWCTATVAWKGGADMGNPGSANEECSGL